LSNENYSFTKKDREQMFLIFESAIGSLFKKRNVVWKDLTPLFCQHDLFLVNVSVRQYK